MAVSSLSRVDLAKVLPILETAAQALEPLRCGRREAGSKRRVREKDGLDDLDEVDAAGELYAPK